MKSLLLILALIGCALAQFDQDSTEHGRKNRPGTKTPSCQCGWRKHPNSRIVGGRIAGVNEWPMIAGIFLHADNKRTQSCGSTILTRRHVLTAAHCFQFFDANSYQVLTINQKFLQILIGGHNYNTAKPSDFIQLQRYVIHPQYDPYRIRNDVAIGVVNNIPFSDNVGPACFPSSRIDLVGQQVNMVGWGLTYRDGNEKIPTSILKSAKANALDVKSCNAILNAFDVSNPHQFCTVDPQNAICQGDSGGPILWRDPQMNRYVVVGVTSVSPSKACSGLSGYAEVGAFTSWVKSVIGKDGQPICE